MSFSSEQKALEPPVRAERSVLDESPAPLRAAAPDPVAFRVRLAMGSVEMDLLDVEAVSGRIAAALRGPRERPLAIGSVNLDHVFHFEQRVPGGLSRRVGGDGPEWVMLVDGAPVSRHAHRRTGLPVPRLTGADLLPVILAGAERDGATVGFLGGEPNLGTALLVRARAQWPDLKIVGLWTPPRAVIDNPVRSTALARTIAAAAPDLLIVGLGKPRQEAWIQRYGQATGAQVLAAFGAAAEFLAGSAPRAPLWMREAGLEWLYRLSREPRRLSRRYLLQGPLSLWAMRRAKFTVTVLGQIDP